MLTEINYRSLVRAEHWNEFQNMVPEMPRPRTPDDQMNDQWNRELAFNKLKEKYPLYYSGEEEDDES